MKRREALAKVTVLLGGSLSAPALLGLLNGCQVKKPGAEGPHTLLFLKPEQDRLVAEIAELIIPATDTPGAKAARVNEFIDLMLADCYAENDRQSFTNGLERLEKESLAHYRKPFLKITSEKQIALLKKEAQIERQPSGPLPFFRTMKELTLIGYFTSEAGATQALEYVPVPGRYEGCVPYQEGQRAWAT